MAQRDRAHPKRTDRCTRGRGQDVTNPITKDNFIYVCICTVWYYPTKGGGVVAQREIRRAQRKRSVLLNATARAARPTRSE
jgi:hypothetical protein